MTIRTRLILIISLGCICAMAIALNTPGRGETEPASFIPPDSDQRAAAVGSLRNISAQLRLAFDPDSDSFSSVPAPGPSDWLANHSELGQTFAQYVRSQPNRPDLIRGKLYFQPLGEFDEGKSPDLKRLQDFASRFFALPVEILPGIKLEGLPIQTRQHPEGHRQLLSTDVLTWLSNRIPADAYCMLAVTMTDLYPDPEWNFVFGQASLRNRVGVYSFARYDPAFYGRQPDEQTEKLVLERSCKVLAHETGHMFGIRHCVHYHCLMNGSNHLDESDANPIHLCPVCLRKMHHAKAFDVENRYQALAEFCESVNWQETARWYSVRATRLKSR
ncbi:archaemetzincin [Stieleria varia]|uniref:Peptidase family M54 n=1 Tax=Stieleria varia TaxID=2528005 RepID=A0A5C6A4R1_9BACT|nr:archaemetzincin [Stieleria varia]TWT94426.1 Peptidase family M54 [Stieleria varia]